MSYRCPSKNQWKQFLKVLTKGERISFFLLFFLFSASLTFLSVDFYFKKTKIVPAPGGTHIEGVVGSPRFINPIYAPLSDIDRDLTQLIFSGLMKYDSQGKIIPDMVKEYRILEDGKVYEFFLKENLFWSDGEKLTSDDVIFTIKTIQNAELKSPLRGSWIGVEVEKISPTALRFKLKNPSAIFLENCTLKILPQHIWGEISPQNFPLSFFNLKPVGSGPYQLKSLLQAADGKVTSLELIRNPYYHGENPYLNQISFRFFEKTEDDVKDTENLVKSYLAGEIKGFSLFSTTNLKNFSSLTNLYRFYMPRYFAVFFNPGKAKIFSQKEVREALNYATDKKEVIDTVLNGKGRIVNSPILPEIYGFNKSNEIFEFNLEKAKEILDSAGFYELENGQRAKIVKKTPSFQFKSNLTLKSQGEEVTELQKCLAKDREVYPEGEITGFFGEKTKAAVIKFQEKYSQDILEPQNLTQGTGDVRQGTRDKLNEICFNEKEEITPLEFTLTTVNQAFLESTAEILASQWGKLGIKVKIQTFDSNSPTLQSDIIKPREYEALLFGMVLGAIPDPFPFWHSGQKIDPGLNLSIFENKNVDKLLEEARQTLDSDKRKIKLEEAQNLIISDSPAIFLYNPDYFYFVSSEIKGIESDMIVDPSKRFSDIENWYTKTKRVWK